VQSLEDQLGQEREANRENRRIIAALTSRMPAIEAPSEERESPETVEGSEAEPKRAEPRSSAGVAEEGAQWRGFWSRLFGS